MSGKQILSDLWSWAVAHWTYILTFFAGALVGHFL